MTCWQWPDLRRWVVAYFTPKSWPAGHVMEWSCSHLDAATEMSPRPPLGPSPWLNLIGCSLVWGFCLFVCLFVYRACPLFATSTKSAFSKYLSFCSSAAQLELAILLPLFSALWEEGGSVFVTVPTFQRQMNAFADPSIWKLSPLLLSLCIPGASFTGSNSSFSLALFLNPQPPVICTVSQGVKPIAVRLPLPHLHVPGSECLAVGTAGTQQPSADIWTWKRGCESRKGVWVLCQAGQPGGGVFPSVQGPGSNVLKLCLTATHNSQLQAHFHTVWLKLLAAFLNTLRK